MIPTLNGRIQTRIFLLVVVGGIWTLIVTPFVKLFVDDGMGGSSTSLGQVYKVTFTVLIIVLVLGILWELVYHALMQFRWEKDWPTLFGWVTFVNEGIVTWLVIQALATERGPGGVEWRELLDGLTVAPFLVHFLTTWIVVNLFVNNLMQVLFIRWRFRGGRILGGWTP